MEPPGGRDSRFQLGYSMNLLSGETPPEIYGGGSGLGRPSTSLQQLSPRHTMVSSACGSRGGGGGGAIKTDVCYDDRGGGGGGGGGMGNPQHGGGMGFDTGGGGVTDIHEDSYGPLQSKKSPPSNGKKTKGRVKIKMEYIENKLRRYTTFSKRKTGIMKKAYELSTLTGTQVMLLVASETGHVYTFATRKLQPMITSEAGKALIQTCLNSPDPPAGAGGGDQRMSATGFEETELTYNISDEDSKELGCDSSEAEDYDDDGSDEDEEPPRKVFVSSTTAATQQDSSKGCGDTSSASPSLSSSSSLSLFDVKKEPTDTIGNKASKTQEADENAKIISQIRQINDALIQSNNKAKAASNQSDVPTTTVAGNDGGQPPVLVSSSQMATVQLTDNVKAVPLIVQSGNGLGFASTPDGMILGVIQGGPESKIVAMPLNSVIAGGIRVAAAPLKVDDDR